jgi:hypothetical protein
MLFINGLKFNTGQVPNDSLTTVPFTQDDVVRDFRDWAEARHFAAQTTDYIGSLPPGSAEPGTWVRFDDADLNIAGEEHDYLPLHRFTSAVRSRSFIYEQFAADVLPPGSDFRNAYLAENNALLVTYGVNVNSNLSGNGRYAGKPFQRYLKIGWGWAKDLAGNPTTANENTLAQAVNTHRGLLNQFITGLPVDGFLGNPLVQGNADKYQPLLELCQA